MKFSIIIPVYNTEKYLPYCFKSILDQTFLDYEIIIVDDGSTDASGKMCDEYADMHDNVVVIHQDNRGVSAARNCGIRKARGEYLLFLDSDDYYPNKNGLMLIAQQATDCDIVAFNWTETWEDSVRNNNFCVGPMKQMKKKYSCGNEYLQDALEQSSLYPWYICIYAIKRSYWVDLDYKFVEGIKYEDVELTYRVLLSAGHVYVLSEDLYAYRRNRPNSTVTGLNVNAFLDILQISSQNILAVCENTEINNILKERLTNNFSCQYYGVMINVSRFLDRDRQILYRALREKQWMCQYTTNRKQKIVRNIMSILGLRSTCFLLGVRRRIKYPIRR